MLDTNVLVSALLSPEGAPAQVLSLVLAGELTLLYDERVLGEYREVLSRPRFGFAPELIDDVLQQMEADGHLVAATRVTAALPDPDDSAFLEVALSGNADALVTGNARHFPPDAGVAVLSPRDLLRRLESE